MVWWFLCKNNWKGFLFMDRGNENYISYGGIGEFDFVGKCD